jgi:hypothetical protein
MKNTIRIFGIVVLVATIVFGFSACPNGNDKEDNNNNKGGNDITYTALPNSETDTTAINFTFTSAVSDLIADNITVANGTGTVTKGSLSGSGVSWSLGITVETAGNITVSVSKSGIESGGKTVAVAKTGGGGTIPTISTETLPGGTVGTASSQTLEATGDAPITWSLDGGTTLPAGLDLAGTGAISGIPITAGTATFTVKAANAAGNNTKQLSITITGGGVNAVSGKTYFEMDRRIIFSTTAGGAVNGTYTTGRTIYDFETRGYEVVDGKYKYVDSEAGVYTWNEEEKTVTMEPERAAFSSSPDWLTDLLDKTTFRSTMQTWENDYKQEIGEAAYNQILSGMGFSSAAAYIDYYVNDVFSHKTNGYSFSNDGTALFLEKTLPSNKGTNELSGQSYNPAARDGKDTNQVYVFTASLYTFTDSRGETETTIGSYTYDSGRKRVWLKPTSGRNGQDRAAYYAAIPASGMQYFVDNNAFRAAQTNSFFDITERQYNSTDMILQ